MSDFQFKYFTVHNDRSAMKVNTDGVLLGAAVDIPACLVSSTVCSHDDTPAGNVLDIGTGTGTIALMLAQRIFAAVSPSGVQPQAGSPREPLTEPQAELQAEPQSEPQSEPQTEPQAVEAPRIYAIDIDVPSVEEARKNFERSPWADRLGVECVPLQEYAPCQEFDLIVSNPPYFDDSLRNPDSRKADARHTNSLSFRDILEFASRRLSEDGLVAMILPSEVEKDLLRCARSYSLYPSRIIYVRTTERKAPRRIIVEFSRCRSVSSPADCNGRPEGVSAGSLQKRREDTLIIMKEGRYTAEYTALLKDFLITL